MAPMGWTWAKRIFSRMVIPATDQTAGKPHFFNISSIFPLLFFWLLFSLLVGWPTHGWSAELRPESATSGFFKDPADFDECVRLALRQSPCTSRTAFQVKTRRSVVRRCSRPSRRGGSNSARTPNSTATAGRTIRFGHVRFRLLHELADYLAQFLPRRRVEKYSARNLCDPDELGRIEDAEADGVDRYIQAGQVL